MVRTKKYGSPAVAKMYSMIQSTIETAIVINREALIRPFLESKVSSRQFVILRKRAIIQMANKEKDSIPKNVAHGPPPTSERPMIKPPPNERMKREQRTLYTPEKMMPTFIGKQQHFSPSSSSKG
eukprot:CAMPEP_0170500614 /NCGR_PEP_ID=MMETSP0208-20121228/35443_1 /TAXON_ID=197538 /ORGANISM="Strombidium inclinatum, Strain S3" /LENGTH=124 /DNA_ID=CAMNT_0010778731 /DNA_START=174 /DNA_END=548 /DNA_ORIENTATION=+